MLCWIQDKMGLGWNDFLQYFVIGFRLNKTVTWHYMYLSTLEKCQLFKVAYSPSSNPLITCTRWIASYKSTLVPAPQKRLPFLVIGRLQNRCGDALLVILLFYQPVKYVICGYWNLTKFPIHKVHVWWLREASQIGQAFIHVHVPLQLKHSAAEFQSI